MNRRKVSIRRVRLTRLRIKISLDKLGKAKGVNSGSKEPSSVGRGLMGGKHVIFPQHGWADQSTS